MSSLHPRSRALQHARFHSRRSEERLVRHRVCIRARELFNVLLIEILAPRSISSDIELASMLIEPFRAFIRHTSRFQGTCEAAF